MRKFVLQLGLFAMLMALALSAVWGANENPVVIATIRVASGPGGTTVNPSTNLVYVSTFGNNRVNVIDGATNTILDKIRVGGNLDSGPRFLGVNPETNRIYVANRVANTVSVIDGEANTVVAAISVGAGAGPFGVGVNPQTNFIYVSNIFANTVSVINGATNGITANVPVDDFPLLFGVNPRTDRVYVSHGGPFDIDVDIVSVIGNSP